MTNFIFNDKVYEYADAEWAQAIELPIFWRRIRQTYKDPDKQVLEVGSVLDNNWHDVLDLYKHGDGIMNYDAAFWRPKALQCYDLIISISTFEHIGHAKYGTDQVCKPMAAALNLYSWALAPGGTMLFSISLRYRPASDWLVWNVFPPQMAKIGFLRKIGHDTWRQIDAKAARKVRYYGKPYPGANCIAIIEVIKPL